MSLGIAFKGPEGIVLAADSRVTLMAQIAGQNVAIPSTFDNATKLLKIEGQKHVGAVTYGLGALGQKQPRTAHSFIPEFETELAGTDRLSVQEFARKLSDFFMGQWKDQGMPSSVSPGQDMVFLVGGYDLDQPYGRVFELHIPTSPVPQEWHVDSFGMVWGGQKEITTRIISGFDDGLLLATQQFLDLQDAQRDALAQHLREKLQLPIPFAFLPLQDCVDLSVALIRATITMQSFIVGVRGVGGAIDVATITRTEGFRAIHIKEVISENKRGERK